MAKKSSVKIEGMPWSFASVWNEGVRKAMPDRPMVKRSHIYASELSGSYIDRYLKMNAHPYSNPFNDRSKCKMVAGAFFEGIVGMVLTAAGILRKKQLHGVVELPKMLKVTGRLDFVAGGANIDWDKAKHEVDEVKKLFEYSLTEMHPFISGMADKVFEHFKQMFTRVPLMEYVQECKSVSGFVYQLIEKTAAPRRGHPLQTLHYLLANKEIPQGLLSYLSREDVMMQEFYIERSKELLKAYKEDVATMTGYYEAGGANYMKHLPPPESEVLFEEAAFRFVKQNKVEYSPYLTMIYKYRDIEHFSDVWTKKLNRWNRAFKRHVLEGTTIERVNKKGETVYSTMKLTAGNIEAIKEAEDVFPEWDKYRIMAKKAGAFQKADENEEED